MSRQTSIEVYEKIKNSGSLSKRRWETYDLIFRHGPLTANEVGVLAVREHGDLTARHNYNSRCGELRDAGVLVEVGTKACSVTGNTAIIWDVTDKLPANVDVTYISRNKLIDKLCFQIERMVRHMQSRQDVPQPWRDWTSVSQSIVSQCARFRRGSVKAKV